MVETSSFFGGSVDGCWLYGVAVRDHGGHCWGNGLNAESDCSAKSTRRTRNVEHNYCRRKRRKEESRLAISRNCVSSVCLNGWWREEKGMFSLSVLFLVGEKVGVV